MWLCLNVHEIARKYTDTVNSLFFPPATIQPGMASWWYHCVCCQQPGRHSGKVQVEKREDFQHCDVFIITSV